MVPSWAVAVLGLSACFAGAGCAGDDQDDVRTVRLEFANEGTVGISVWAKALDGHGAILAHMQVRAEPDQTRSHEQLLVVSSLVRFEAEMSLAGERPRTVTSAFDAAACAGVDPVVFRIVARGDGLAGPDYEPSVNCP